LHGERVCGGAEGSVVVEAYLAEIFCEVAVDLCEEGMHISQPSFDVFYEEVHGLRDFVLSICFEVPFDFCEFCFVEEAVGSVGGLCFVVEFDALIGRGEI
jgi:hypothetical protein